MCLIEFTDPKEYTPTAAEAEELLKTAIVAFAITQVSCKWGISQIKGLSVPIKKEYDKRITAYAINDFDNTRMVLLLSSEKPMDDNDVRTSYVSLKKGIQSCHFV